MGKWLIAILIGAGVIVGVYFLRENIISAPPGSVPAAADSHDGMAMPSAPETPAAPAESESATDEEDVTSAPTSDGPKEIQTIPAGSAKSLISVDFPWARSTAAGQDVTAVYMLLTNSGQADALLVGADSPEASRVEIHQTTVNGSVVSMKQVKQLDLEPGVPTALEQGGLHLMVFGLKKPLKDGDTLKVTLDFGAAGKIDVAVPVGEPDDTGDTPQP